jgi:hypothetical protein
MPQVERPEPAISKEAFIRQYGVDEKYKTETGYYIPDSTPKSLRPSLPHAALRCFCGEDICEGWAMVQDDRKEDSRYGLFALHCRQNGLNPETGEVLPLEDDDEQS